MRRVLNIDEENSAVTVEAGITLAEMATKVQERGWDVHTAAQPYYGDTFGGQLSGVMGGGTGAELTSAGWNTHHLYGLKVVLPDGTILQTGTGPGTNTSQRITYAREPGSPDITGLFIGDAGIFGIKTEATYRMYRLPKIREGWACAFDTFEDAWRFCKTMALIEPQPYAMIVMIPPTATLKALMGLKDWLTMCIFKANREDEAEWKRAVIKEAVKDAGGRLSDDPASREWVDRAVSLKAHREMGEFASLGVWTYLELIAPPSEVPECFHFVKSLHEGTLEKNNIPYHSNNGIVSVGGNQWIITSIIFLEGSDARAMGVMRELWARGLEMGTERGWFPDAHQGYGTIVIAKHWSPEVANFMRTLKRALDPNNIMNPGLWSL
jgi:FAD/FMN-containing dehydrogenase